jgi:hypothetical protein
MPSECHWTIWSARGSTAPSTKNCQTPAGHRKTAVRGQESHLRTDGRIPLQVPGAELPQRIKHKSPALPGFSMTEIVHLTINKR